MGLFSKLFDKNTPSGVEEKPIKFEPGIAFECDKCGWQLMDGEDIPDVCPECGDPIDEDDIY